MSRDETSTAYCLAQRGSNSLMVPAFYGPRDYRLALSADGSEMAFMDVYTGGISCGSEKFNGALDRLKFG